MNARKGLTLVELIVAAALLMLVTLAVFQFLRGFMSLWQKSEARRELAEEASAVVELVAADFAAIANGSRADLLAEWVFFDTDGDGLAETIWPRVRLVRQASAGEVARLQAGLPEDAERIAGEALVEVAWTVTPAHVGRDADRRAEGILWRGEHLHGAQGFSYFEPSFFGQGHKPRTALNEVAGGVLYVGMQFATQTTSVARGWKLGKELADAASSWDAWSKARPDAARHYLNEPGAGMPKPRGRALLPRRVRFELELERPSDLKRRTRVAEDMTMTDTVLVVDDPERLAPNTQRFVKVDAEWLEIRALDGKHATVARGARGTQAAGHSRGALIHWGLGLAREIDIRVEQEDWGL